MGNRITQETLAGTNNYVYDIANRLIEVDGVAYSWDANGNLLNDGMRTYSYNHANRLTGVVQGGDEYTFAYNGQGDRLQQVVNGVPANYTLDLNTGLTQILAEETSTYLYGNGRIGEEQAGGWQYHLGDALGSVRQLSGPDAALTLAQSYTPYGEILASYGSGQSVFQYTGEARDGTGLVYLRMRYLNTDMGRFLTRERWIEDSQRPLSLNKWNYVEGNPINRTDASGRYWWGPGQALWNASELNAQSQNIHVRIQALWMLARMDQVHAEYVIPGTFIPIDLLDSISGEIWEIKPWDDQAQAKIDLKKRITGMNHAKGLLSGMNPVGMPYNWNFNPIVWLRGFNFPSADIYIGVDDSGWFDFYAKQTEPCVIAWWKHLRLRPEQVPYPIVLPDEVTWSQRNRRLGWQPAFASIPLSGGIPYPLQGRDPVFQPGFGKGCAIPFDGIEIDPLTGVVIVGGSYVLGNIIWWLGKTLAPLCGPAAPACLIIL